MDSGVEKRVDGNDRHLSAPHEAKKGVWMGVLLKEGREFKTMSVVRVAGRARGKYSELVVIVTPSRFRRPGYEASLLRVLISRCHEFPEFMEGANELQPRCHSSRG